MKARYLLGDKKAIKHTMEVINSTGDLIKFNMLLYLFWEALWMILVKLCS